MTQSDLRTERLLLRRFHLDDANEVQVLAGNVNVSRMTLNVPYPYELEMAEEWIRSHQEKFDGRASVTYAIVKLDSNQLLGTIGLVSIDGSEGELGYWIGEPYWGLGYCTEAARELIQFSFKHMGLDRIVAEHLTSNPASGKVMVKAGMAHLMTTQKTDRYAEKVSMEVYEIRSAESAPVVGRG
ncbi:MAG: RimJ/RimL family protein N-acetyltransferase [Candidatus Azotimanducaceae bacterium]|jgi:ribosomal-protein-alanine N-acetyltransferase